MILAEGESLTTNVYGLATMTRYLHLAQDTQVIHERIGVNVLTHREENSESNYANVSCQVCKYKYRAIIRIRIPSPFLNYSLISAVQELGGFNFKPC